MRNGATVSAQSRLEVTFIILSNAGDWILDAALCASTAYLLTAHNVLLELPIVDRQGQRGSVAYDETTSSIIRGPKSFLYSGRLLIARPDLILVASGTVFGEILVWTAVKIGNAHEWSTYVKYVCKGHSGSVFGVAISEAFKIGDEQIRLLASSSDDRTVKIWDISACDQSEQGAPSGPTLVETGFGSSIQSNESLLTSAWGHLSRIWGVDFVKRPADEDGHGILLLSRGEDAAFQLWSVDISKGQQRHRKVTAYLRAISSDRHHAGKNAWSMAQARNDQGLNVYTGGADGQIISRRFDVGKEFKDNSVIVSAPFKEVTSFPMTLKHYRLLDHRECLATTDQGDLFRLRLEAGNLGWNRISQNSGKGGIVLCTAETVQFTLVAYQKGGLSALLTRQNGLIPIPWHFEFGISWMQVASQTPSNASSFPTCVVAVLANKEVLILWVGLDEDSFQVSHTALNLPDTFTVTACCYNASKEILLLGSRAGAVAVYSHLTSTSETAGEAVCVRHIHGSDSVTSIMVLERSSDTEEVSTGSLHVLTTGRDGRYAIHSLAYPVSRDHGEPELSVIHLSVLPFGPNIEGAYLVAPTISSSLSPPDLVLYGFRSTSFLVWNESQQSTVLSVECGGSHRSWSYRDSANVTNKNAASNSVGSARAENATKSFVWTKAGKFNWHTSQRPSHKVIHEGGHGREIKAVAFNPAPYFGSGNNLSEGILIATGAEDTTIHLFALPTPESESRTTYANVNDRSAFHRLATLKQHTTGLQHLKFSPSGNFLFSSAGCEEFYVWKLSFNVPCIGVGTVLWDIMPTEEEDSDARIMSFDLLFDGCDTDKGIENNGDADGWKTYAQEKYTIAMAYSNGKSKIVRYTPSTARNQGIFETRQEISYGSFCVIQAFFLQARVSATSPHGAVGFTKPVLSAGTNGFLNLNEVDLGVALPQSPFAMDVHRVHQSSILAMDVMPLNSDTYLIATGGDDNALGLTFLTSLALVNKEAMNTRESQRRFRTIVIPHAHAAAVTALKITKLHHTKSGLSVALITVGNDQRVKAWNVRVDVQKAALIEDDRLFEAMRIDRAGTAWTSVADVSGLEVVEDIATGEDGQGVVTDGKADERAHKKCRVLVVGVGMELLSVPWNGEEK